VQRDNDVLRTVKTLTKLCLFEAGSASVCVREF